jgi:hypothetical protein
LSATGNGVSVGIKESVGIIIVDGMVAEGKGMGVWTGDEAVESGAKTVGTSCVKVDMVI